MRLAGASYDAIARAIDGVSDADHAAREAQLALQTLEGLAGWESDNRTAMEHAKLDILERNVTAVLQNASGGGDGRLADPAVVLQATDRLLKISQMRAALDAREGGNSQPEDPLVAIQNAIGLKLVHSSSDPS